MSLEAYKEASKRIYMNVRFSGIIVVQQLPMGGISR